MILDSLATNCGQAAKGMTMFGTGVNLALTSVLLMAAAIVFANVDGMFWPSQFRTFYNVGFPVAANGCVWGNLFLLSAVFYIIGGYLNQWGGKEVGAALVGGIAISYLLFHFVYLRGNYPDGLAGGGEPISRAGWVVMVYGGIAYALVGLFFFRTSAAPKDVLIVCALLALYIPAANHAVLAGLNHWCNFRWCPPIFTEEASPLRFIIVGELVVAGATVAKMSFPKAWW